MITPSNSLLLNLWPLPTNISHPNPNSTSPLSPSFSILLSSHHPYLSSAASRFTHQILSSRHVTTNTPSSDVVVGPTSLTSLTLSVDNPTSPLEHGADESYTLSVPSNSTAAYVTSATAWGAMRALETFSQLVSSHRGNLVVASGIWIQDTPLFAHRGILLDTARNYYPVRDIKRTLDAMAMNKMNVFHWHLTDSQSFPVVLPSVPELGEKGAYGPGMKYTASDVMEVVEYATERGVRVMPEFDMPGHGASWAEAYPDIVTCAGKFWADGYAVEPAAGQLNPLKPETYTVVNNVIRDAASLFPESFFHAGADEINSKCWSADPTVQSFVSSGGTLSEALEIFINKTHPVIVAENRTVVYWEDVIFSSEIKVGAASVPTETTIMQTWNNGVNNTKLLVQAGYRVIVSSADFYYLDCGHGGWVGNDSRYDITNDAGTNGGSWCAPFKTWQRIYDYDIASGLTPSEKSLVLGAEVALWSEQSDATVLDARLWPRAAAMAEAMWSGNRDKEGKKRYAEATGRLLEWRERMVERGIMAEPLMPAWCRKKPSMCNLVM